jgi:predicted nucleic acid-binding Zn ribbon protein
MTSVPRESNVGQVSIADYCAACGAPIAQPRTGRRRRTCSEKCRQRVSRNTRRQDFAAPFRDTATTSALGRWHHPSAQLAGEDVHLALACRVHVLENAWAAYRRRWKLA